MGGGAGSCPALAEQFHLLSGKDERPFRLHAPDAVHRFAADQHGGLGSLADDAQPELGARGHPDHIAAAERILSYPVHTEESNL